MIDGILGQPANTISPRSLGRLPNQAAPGTQGAPKEAWKLQYTDANGFVQNIALGADNTVYKSTGTATAPEMALIAPAELVGGTWKLLYTNGTGVVTELALGAKGALLASTGASAAPVELAAGNNGEVLSADSAQSSGLLWKAITGGAMLPGIPPRFTAPIDVTIGSNTTLTARLNYFKTLTVSNGFTLTGLAGGTIIICEEGLVNAGTISVNALGAKGGAATAAGNGGGAWSPSSVAAGPTRTAGAFMSTTTIAASVPYAVAPMLQRFMAVGGGTTSGAVGIAGSAWPFATGSIFEAGSRPPVDLLLTYWLMELILQGAGVDHATVGGIGGGGGGGGEQTATTSANFGLFGGTGLNQTGGSGFGGGGGGGSGTGVTGGAGGRGGGALLIFCKTLNNTGTISANGDNGTNGATAGGGGGGGGGGMVVVAYETLTAAGTIQANGGTGGTNGGGSGFAGGNGGAGTASSFLIRSGS